MANNLEQIQDIIFTTYNFSFIARIFPAHKKIPLTLDQGDFE